MSSERVLQAAVYVALTTDAGLNALVASVYDHVAPDGAEYPFTVLGDMTEDPAHTHDLEGWGHTLTIHDFDGGPGRRGRKRLQQIREARDDVLHDQTLTVSGWGLTKIRREFAQVLLERDEAEQPIYHQVTRYACESLES